VRYTRVIVHFINGESTEFNHVIEQQQTDGEYRFEGQHYKTRYTVMKRNTTFIERIH